MPAKDGYYKPGKQSIEETILRLTSPKKLFKQAVSDSKENAKKQLGIKK